MPPQPTESFDIDPSTLALSNTTTLITGGSNGIGLSTAQLIHSLTPSNNVVVLDLKPPAPSSLTSSPRFLYVHCDVTSFSSQRAAFAKGVAHFGRIDNVFVNAGINEYGDQIFTDKFDEQGELIGPDHRTLNIDLLAALDTIKLAVHHFRRQAKADSNLAKPNDNKQAGGKDTRDDLASVGATAKNLSSHSQINNSQSLPRSKPPNAGSLVLTASLAGYLSSAGAPLYSAAKAGLVGFLRALKHDLSTLNISISLVAPGITLTEIVAGRAPNESLQAWAERMRGQGVPINSPEEISRVVVWLMGLGMDAHGKGIMVQAGRCADVEKGYAKHREGWMGEDMVRLFRGGRGANLFPNKL